MRTELVPKLAFNLHFNEARAKFEYKFYLKPTQSKVWMDAISPVDGLVSSLTTVLFVIGEKVNSKTSLDI